MLAGLPPSRKSSRGGAKSPNDIATLLDQRIERIKLLEARAINGDSASTIETKPNPTIEVRPALPRLPDRRYRRFSAAPPPLLFSPPPTRRPDTPLISTFPQRGDTNPNPHTRPTQRKAKVV